MEHPPTSRPEDRPRRPLGKALRVLAVLVGCGLALAGLLALVATTESPVDGPIAPLLAVALVAAPVVIAAVLVARVLGGGPGRDDDQFLS
jgi:peptidoglycan/LPS O-acetylase OafA/YrhL